MGDTGGQDVVPLPGDDYDLVPPPPDSSLPPPAEELSPPPPSEDPSPPPPDSSPPPSSPSPPPPSTTPDPTPSPPPPEDEKPSPSPPPLEKTNPPPPADTSPVTDPTSPSSPPPPVWAAPVTNSTTPLLSNTSASPAPVGSSLSPPPSLVSSSSLSNSGIIIGGLLCGVLVIAMIIALVTCCLKKKKKRMQYYMDPPPPKQGEYYNNWNSTPPNDHIVKLHPQPSWGSPPTGHLSNEFMIPSPGPSIGHNQSSFTYDQLAVATSEFSKANLLGQGGFGYVHKGVLPDGREVAVKSLKLGSGQGEREFQAEVEIISRVHHRHLVSLVGYCILGEQRMLVYEFVPNKTLEFHLHGKGQPVMDWATRMRIALGSSKGLGYLHEDCHPKIIHRDIKAANILLDNNFEAMVADFGLAKLSSDNNTHVSTRVMGTFGYLAPEYASSGKLTDKSDVFSFGVMLLELITGRKPVDASNYMEDSLVDWARPLLSRALEDGNYKGLVDPLLENNYNSDEMACMVACAAASIRHSAKRRPKMTQIVRALEGDISLDDLIDGPNPIQSSISSSIVSSSDSGLYDTGAYNADMMKFRKMVMANETVDSSEYEATSEYGLNPSSSSSDMTDDSSMHRGKM